MSHDLYNIDREDRDQPFSTDPGRTVAENTKFIEYREMYLAQGYPFDVAEQYAWDNIWSNRRAQKVEA